MSLISRSTIPSLLAVKSLALSMTSRGSKRSTIPSLLAVTFLALSIPPASPSPAAAYDIVFSPWGEAAQGAFGYEVRALADVDNNGVPDFLVGDPLYSGDGPFHGGRAYLYLCDRNPLHITEVVLPRGSSDVLFGKAMAALGDVNGDGFADFAITSEDIDQTHLYLGGAIPAEIQELPIPLPAGVRTSGVGALGDVNGDGYDDFAIGALWEGKAYVFLGRPNPVSSPDLVIQNSDPLTATPFGKSIVGLGDQNGDGYDDFAIGIYGVHVDGVVHPGVAIYFGGSSIDPAPTYLIDQPGGTGTFGSSMGLAGDWTGDGIPELLVHDLDPQEITGSSNDALLVYSYFPGQGFFQGDVIGGTAGLSAGPSFASGCDIDGDGLADLVFQARPAGSSGSTLAYIPGSAHRLGSSHVQIPLALGSSGLGVHFIDSIGDLTGDGLPELLVGSPNDSTQFPSGGRAYLIRGGSRRIMRLKAGQAMGPIGTEVVVPISIAVDKDPAAGPTTLAALDLELGYDSAVMTFQSAQLVHPTGQWLMEVAGSDGVVDIAMVAQPAPTLAGAEEPFLELHFTLGSAPGSTRLTLLSGRANARHDLPLWYTFESGSIIASVATDTPGIPAAASLQCYPNPFNPRTTLVVDVPRPGPAVLQIFDARGRVIWERHLDRWDSGAHRVVWAGEDRDGHPLPSGVYFAKARGKGWNARTRLLLLR